MILTITIVFIFFIIIFPFFKRDGNNTDSDFMNKEKTTLYKGIAIIIIILCHSIGLTHETVIATPLGSIGVSMFLILSGFGLEESYKKNYLNKFWQKKILRIFIPYLIFITTISLINHNSFNILNFIKDIFFISTSYWYIGYIVKWYIIFYLSSLFNEKYKYQILIAAAIISFIFLPDLESKQSLSFPIGVAISKNHSNILKISNKKLYIIAFSFFIIGTFALGVKQFDYVRDTKWLLRTIQLLISFPLALSIILFLRNINIKNQIISYCGIYSLELYLVHMQTLHIINTESTINKFIYTYAIFIVSTIIICIIYRYITNKINDMLKRI